MDNITEEIRSPNFNADTGAYHRVEYNNDSLFIEYEGKKIRALNPSSISDPTKNEFPPLSEQFIFAHSAVEELLNADPLTITIEGRFELAAKLKPVVEGLLLETSTEEFKGKGIFWTTPGMRELIIDKLTQVINPDQMKGQLPNRSSGEERYIDLNPEQLKTIAKLFKMNPSEMMSIQPSVDHDYIWIFTNQITRLERGEIDSFELGTTLVMEFLNNVDVHGFLNMYAQLTHKQKGQRLPLYGNNGVMRTTLNVRAEVNQYLPRAYDLIHSFRGKRLTKVYNALSGYLNDVAYTLENVKKLLKPIKRTEA
jgi:hypothetical protein